MYQDASDWKELQKEKDSQAVKSETRFVFKPSYIIIVIDTHESMFNVSGNENSPFKTCIEACYKIADSLVIADGRLVKSRFCIVLAGKQTLIDFEKSIPDIVKSLSVINQQTNGQLKESFERKSDFELADMLFMCKQNFMKAKTEASRRIIIYITNDDNPVNDSIEKKYKATLEFESFVQWNISLELVTMYPDFDLNKVYLDMCSQNLDKQLINISRVTDLDGLVDLITPYIQTKYVEWRMNFYPFADDNERCMKVNVVAMISAAKLYNNAHASRDTHKLVKKIKYKEEADDDDEEMQAVLKKEYYLTFSKRCDPLMLTENNKRKLCSTKIPCGLTLLCVSEKSSNVGWIIKPSQLIRADPKETLPYFNLFWQFCVDKSRVLICARKSRINSKRIDYVELEPKLVNNIQMFCCKTLPTEEEINFNPPAIDEIVTSGQQAISKKIIYKLKFDYHPKLFVDPILSKKKAYLRSQILEEPLEEVTDTTLSDEINEQIAEAVESFKSEFNISSFSGKRKVQKENTNIKASKLKR